MTVNTCQNDRKFVHLSIVRTFLFVFVISMVIVITNNVNNNLTDTIKSFNNNEEIQCQSGGITKIVSKPKGFYYDSKNSNSITNGDIIFTIENCTRSDN